MMAVPMGRPGGFRLRRLSLGAWTAAIVGLGFALCPAGSAVAAPVDLSATGQNANNAQVAVDGSGNATAVWQRFNGSNFIVQSAVRPAGGSWSAPVDLSATGQDAEAQQLALDASGNATAVWSRYNGTNQFVQSAVRPAGGSWSAPVDLSATGQDAFNPQVAVDGSGNATAIWYGTNGTNYIVQSAVHPAGGSWSAPVDLSATGQDASEAQVAVDGSGNATAVWFRSNGTNDIVQSAVRPAGGSWSAPVDLSATGRNAGAPQVAVDTSGNATAVWQRHNGTHLIVQSAVRPAGDPWSAPVDLSATGQFAQQARVVVDGSGNATAVWFRSNGTNQIVQSAVRPAGGSWSAPVDLSATGRDAVSPQVAVDGPGNATAVWDRSNGTNNIVQSAEYRLDSTAPAPPSGLTISPASPAAETAPKVAGSAEAGATVRVYANASCTGTPAATGTATAFASPGLAVTVAADSTTTFSATATDPAANTSACSSTTVTYTQKTPAAQSASDPATPATSTDPAVPAEMTPVAAPDNNFTIGRPTLSRRTLTVPYGLPGAGVLEVLVHHPRRPVRRLRVALRPGPGRYALARARLAIPASGPATVNLKLSRAGRRMLRRNNHYLTLVLTARFTPAGGTPRKISRIVVLGEVRRAGKWVLIIRSPRKAPLNSTR
jgi:hypothetical protein